MAIPGANIDASLGGVFRQSEETIARTQRMFETLREAFETYLESLPPNIRAVRELWISKLHDCACAGIPVWHVPRTEVIDALMDASSTDRRYRVLDHYRAEIIEDCREQIELLEPNDRPVLIEMKATFGAEG